MEILPVTRVGARAGGDARAASPGTAGTDSGPRRLLKAVRGRAGAQGMGGILHPPQQASRSSPPHRRGAAREVMPQPRRLVVPGNDSRLLQEQNCGFWGDLMVMDNCVFPPVLGWGARVVALGEEGSIAPGENTFLHPCSFHNTQPSAKSRQIKASQIQFLPAATAARHLGLKCPRQSEHDRHIAFLSHLVPC